MTDKVIHDVTDPAFDLDPGTLSLERVGAELCRLAGQIAAATSRFLRLLADFDARQGWAGWNVKSCAHWLSWRCGLDLRTAREHVRVARALTDLPRIRDSFDAGRISYSKVRAIARVATPTSEADLLDAALHAPAAHVERLTRGMRTAQQNSLTPDDVGVKPQPKTTPRRRIRWRWDYDEGDLIIYGRLAPEDGARLLAAATRAAIELTRREPEPSEPPGPAVPSTVTVPDISPRATATSADQSGRGDSNAAADPTRGWSQGTAACLGDPTSTTSPAPSPDGDGSAEPSPSKADREPHQLRSADGTAESAPENRTEQEPNASREQPALTTRPPSDLAPALVAMAEMVCSHLAAPVHAPAADVLVTVDIDTLADAFANIPRNHGDPEQGPTHVSAAEPIEPGAARAPRWQPAAESEPVAEPESDCGPAPDPAGMPGRCQGSGGAGKHQRDARLDDGPALVSSCLRRLANDGRLRFAVTTPDGHTLDVGRMRRTPNASQLRALWRRDRGCAVPGCGRIRFLHAHHVVFWTNGGRTSLDNLVLLCGEHHRALHEGTFAITALGDQRFRFTGPRGGTYSPAPPISGRADDLVAEHSGIEPDTIEPDWDGTPVHSFAVATYLAAWNAEISRNKTDQQRVS